MRRLIPTTATFLLLFGCASHPTINPHLPEPGKVKKGYALSTENVFPYLWIRKGLTDKSEIGFRVGLPIYGTGIDYSRVVYQKENKWDLINLAWSINPNFNFDATYYKFKTKKTNLNFFKGKPVEGCFSHNGKYLWITYYRRSYDLNAIDPSAVCIIDTEFDSIIRVIPTGSLPKMIRCSPDNKTIAITHWGDNTVTLMDISSDDPSDFKFKENIIIDYKPKLNYDLKEKINRDQNCYNCLRGTVFTKDSKYILIGKMGSNSIAIINSDSCKYIGSVEGTRTNMRHLIIKDNNFYMSINKWGYIQKTQIDTFISHVENNITEQYDKWEEVFVGYGARTISIGPTGKYIFVAVNNESKVVVVRTKDMKIISSCLVDSYPVGLDVSNDGEYLVITSQGKEGEGGNSVMIFDIIYK